MTDTNFQVTSDMPPISHIKRFGSRCVVQVPREDQTKGEKCTPSGKSWEGIFVGIKQASHGYVILLDGPEGSKPEFRVSRNVTFFDRTDEDDRKSEIIDPLVDSIAEKFVEKFSGN